ncbi:MAG: hypothetical protein JWL66_1656 [Sphingomonadales bacterium]|nr:hypothetical protein [Sphingomonadales bacterium]
MHQSDDHPGFSFDDFSDAPLSPAEIREARKLLTCMKHHRELGDPQSKDTFGDPMATGVLAQRILTSRRKRAEIFGADLFADPSYDILLAMIISWERNELVSVSSACFSANVPEATALRYIKSLTVMGYIERIANPHDKRGVDLRLTPVAVDHMTRWLDRFALALNGLMLPGEPAPASSELVTRRRTKRAGTDGLKVVRSVPHQSCDGLS